MNELLILQAILYKYNFSQPNSCYTLAHRHFDVEFSDAEISSIDSKMWCHSLQWKNITAYFFITYELVADMITLKVYLYKIACADKINFKVN